MDFSNILASRTSENTLCPDCGAKLIITVNANATAAELRCPKEQKHYLTSLSPPKCPRCQENTHADVTERTRKAIFLCVACDTAGPVVVTLDMFFSQGAYNNRSGSDPAQTAPLPCAYLARRKAHIKENFPTKGCGRTQKDGSVCTAKVKYALGRYACLEASCEAYLKCRATGCNGSIGLSTSKSGNVTQTYCNVNSCASKTRPCKAEGCSGDITLIKHTQSSPCSVTSCSRNRKTCKCGQEMLTKQENGRWSTCTVNTSCTIPECKGTWTGDFNRSVLRCSIDSCEYNSKNCTDEDCKGKRRRLNKGGFEPCHIEDCRTRTKNCTNHNQCKGTQYLKTNNVWYPCSTKNCRTRTRNCTKHLECSGKQYLLDCNLWTECYTDIRSCSKIPGCAGKERFLTQKNQWSRCSMKAFHPPRQKSVKRKAVALQKTGEPSAKRQKKASTLSSSQEIISQVGGILIAPKPSS